MGDGGTRWRFLEQTPKLVMQNNSKSSDPSPSLHNNPLLTPTTSHPCTSIQATRPSQFLSHAGSKPPVEEDFRPVESRINLSNMSSLQIGEELGNKRQRDYDSLYQPEAKKLSHKGYHQPQFFIPCDESFHSEWMSFIEQNFPQQTSPTQIIRELTACWNLHHRLCWPNVLKLMQSKPDSPTTTTIDPLPPEPTSRLALPEIVEKKGKEEQRHVQIPKLHSLLAALDAKHTPPPGPPSN